MDVFSVDLFSVALFPKFIYQYYTPVISEQICEGDDTFFV